MININTEIMNNIINSALENNDAEDIFNKILSVNPDKALTFCENGLKETKDPDYAIYLGHAYLTLGEYEKALECIDIALESGSDYYVYAYNVKAEAFLEMGMYTESRIYFEKVLEIEEDQLFAKECLLELDIREENYLDAIERCNDYILKYPENTESVAGMKSTLGWIYMDNINDPDLAEISFNEAIKIDPRGSRAYTGLGILYITQEKYREAIVLLEKAKALDESDSENYFMLALSYKALEDFKLVEELLFKAETLNPEDNRILLQIAFEMNRQERYYEAIEYFNKVLALNPDDDFTWNDMGDAYKANKEFKEALRCYTKAYEIDNEDELYKENINNIKSLIS